jgi:hypothetical protein
MRREAHFRARTDAARLRLVLPVPPIPGETRRNRAIHGPAAFPRPLGQEGWWGTQERVWAGTSRRGPVAILTRLCHTAVVGRSIECLPAGGPLNGPRLALREQSQQDIIVNRLD